MSETLAREAGIHEFQCQKEPFLELMMMDYNVHARSAGDERDPGPGGRHPCVPVPEGAIRGAHDLWIKCMYRHIQLMLSEALAREAGIHEFQCQKASFLELMIDESQCTGTDSW
jgi:hypothetical protein